MQFLISEKKKKALQKKMSWNLDIPYLGDLEPVNILLLMQTGIPGILSRFIETYLESCSSDPERSASKEFAANQTEISMQKS